MPTSRRFLTRRWLLGSLVAAALLFGVLMLHPYPRQSLFGPTIRGKPWCVWENTIRRQYSERPESWPDEGIGAGLALGGSQWCSKNCSMIRRCCPW